MGANGTLECANCGATVTSLPGERCDRCGAAPDGVAGAIVVFTERAREVGVWLGGLLKLSPVRGNAVKFVGHGPAGAFGIDAAGRVIWCEDWGWMSSCEWQDGRLYLGGTEADPDTGKPAVVGSGGGTTDGAGT
jgi:hypothetical protein